MEKFIYIKSKRFLPLPNEDEELVNDGMYGKALSIYLQEELKACGYDVPFFCCEDWGWWVEIKSFPFVLGFCIYSGEKNKEEMEYAISDGAISEKKWNWRKFRFIDTAPYVKKLIHDVLKILQRTEGITFIDIKENFPIGLHE